MNLQSQNKIKTTTTTTTKPYIHSLLGPRFFLIKKQSFCICPYLLHAKHTVFLPLAEGVLDSLVYGDENLEENLEEKSDLLLDLAFRF